MKVSQILAILGFSAVSMAQTLAPSPTESMGCVAHDDHWHCEGARSTTEVATGTTLSTAVAATTSAEDHDHDHDHSSGASSYTLPPSPTGRGSCTPHNDHWHCEVAASKTSTASGASGASSNAAETAGTSATAATTTGAAATSASGSAEASTTAVPAGAARAGFGAAAIVAALMAF